jgi:hypothetical protein
MERRERERERERESERVNWKFGHLYGKIKDIFIHFKNSLREIKGLL